MNEDIIFDIPAKQESMIKVIGVGGGGGNAVNYMYQLGIKDVEFILCNTDSQVMDASPVATKIQLGASRTQGKGAGNDPAVGEQAAVESLPEIVKMLGGGTKMVFITAGMGGGTGTGAAPIIAKAAKDLDILTVAIVTIPFRTEGKRRINQAIDGIEKIRKNVDALLVVNNEKILEMYGNLMIDEAFAKADDVLATAAKGIAEIITVHGYINVDFADVQSVMTNSDVAIMGAACATGENRALDAARLALESPLLNNNDISGAKNILLNLTYGKSKITMREVGSIIEFVQAAAGNGADVIWGNGLDESLEDDEVKVTIIATGFGVSSIPELYSRNIKAQKVTLGGVAEAGAVHNKMQQKKITVLDPAQRTIEFEVTPDISSIDAAAHLLKHGSGEQLLRGQGGGFGQIDGMDGDIAKANISDLDNIPAYERQKVQIDYTTDRIKRDGISRIKLVDGEGDIIFRPDNSFLHDNVD